MAQLGMACSDIDVLAIGKRASDVSGILHYSVLYLTKSMDFGGVGHGMRGKGRLVIVGMHGQEL